MMQVWQLLDKLDEIESSQIQNHGVLQALLKLAEPNVTWFLPDGAPDLDEFKGVEPSQAQTTLVNELRRLRVFHTDAAGKDPYPTMKPTKRESLFVETLKVLPHQEVKLLVAIKDKTVADVFPELAK